MQIICTALGQASDAAFCRSVGILRMQRLTFFMYPRRIFQIFLCIAIYSYSISPLNKTLNANNDHNHVCFLVCEAWKRDGGGKLVSRGGKSLVTLVPDSPLQLHWRRPLTVHRPEPSSALRDGCCEQLNIVDNVDIYHI